nr:hypothetical protein [uncultured Mediterranean phage uvMED]
MGGPSSNRSDDSGGGGTYADQLKASQRKKKIENLLTPLPIKIIKSIAKSVDPKRNRKSKSGDVYDANEAREKIDYKPGPTINNDSGRDDPPPVDVRTGKTQKSIEQPKVSSQMDNSDVKSDLITADKTAPTSVEMTDDERMLKVKRGKKTKTVLTDITGLKDQPTLSKKTLLGV